jgi:DnaJ-class molecular chaperone
MADKPTQQQSGGQASAPDQQQQQAVPTRRHMAPGDQAPEGTPGTGENVCSACNGAGIRNGETCPECEGSGYVITGIGGA